MPEPDIDLDPRLEELREPSGDPLLIKPFLDTAEPGVNVNARLSDALAQTTEQDRAWVETREPQSDLLSPDMAAERAFESVSRAIDLMLGSVIGYFVSEPELTPQQVHDLTRANAERDESRAIDLAARENAAALDATNWDINHNRSPVPGGAGDEVHRGESIYDRYPGLTQDIETSYAQIREEDRAFYDTGIERER